MTFKSKTFKLRKLHQNIYELVYKSDGKVVPNVIVKEHKAARYFDREWNILKKLHDVPEVPSAITRQWLYIVMTKLPGEPLIDILIDGRVFTEPEIRDVLRQLILILLQIHARGVIHRDVKLDNILLDDKGKVYLIDFDQKLTRRYTSPENLKQSNVFFPSNDVWGVGIVCYQMLLRYCPWKTNREVLGKQYRSIRRKCTPELRDLISRLFTKDVASRLTLEEALEHDWFKKST